MRISFLEYVKCVYVHPTATYIGGGSIVGLSEMVYYPSMGLCWASIVFLIKVKSSFSPSPFSPNSIQESQLYTRVLDFPYLFTLALEHTCFLHCVCVSELQSPFTH